MSVKAMSMLWEHSKQSGSALLMLLAIADHAKDDGTGAWPSLATLARKTRMSRRNAIEVIKKLEVEGEIIVKRGTGPRGCNIYDLAFTSEAQFTSKNETKKTTVKPSSPEVVKPDSLALVKPSSPEVVKPDSPEPSCNHHVTINEPSERGAAEKTPPASAPSRDYLGDLFKGNTQDNGLDPGVADPSQDIEQYMRYTNDFLEMYRKRTGLHADSHVQKPAIQEIATRPGADLDLWDNVITAWIKHGWNKRNVAGMIECYDRGEIPSTGNGGKPNATNRRNSPGTGIPGNRKRPEYKVADPSKFEPAGTDT